MLSSDRLADVTAGDATQRTKFFCLQVSAWPIVSRDRAKVIALTEIQGAESGFAELCRIRQHGLKDRPQLAGGRADNAQHFRRGRLLLQRLPQFIEQPRVLDGDDGLRGEVLHQCDLFIGERPHLLSIHINRADELAFLEHWHAHQGPYARYFDEANYGIPFRDVGLIGSKVRDVDYLFCAGDAVERDSWIFAQIDHPIAPQIIIVAFIALDCDRAEGTTFEEQKITEGGLTD